MSQNGSSIAGQNPELKYRKALMQIQKIHNANKVLKNQSEQMRDEYQRQISQLNNLLQQHQKEYEALKHDKADIQKYYDELQISHSELRKEYTSLQREYAYLNDVLTQQNNELKKVNAFKDEKGLTTLISSYQDKQMNYRKDISRLEQNIKNLKSNYEAIENDLAEQKRQRFKLQDLNNNLRMQITKYRQLNNTLINKNQNIVATLLNRSSQGKEKYREAETMLRELSKQLQLIKNTRIEQATSNKGIVSMQSYENALHQKSKLQTEVLKLRQRLNEYESKTISNYQMEQKMKKALLYAQQLQEQCNMLKGKLILVQTKDVMDGSTQFGDLKDLQEKILAGISQNDPLVSIKNSSDSSHFQLMKSYIIELKDKLSKAMIEKKEVEKKYRSLKEKLTDKAEKAISYEEQNKLLKGKLEGYQRLTQRLQFELQRSIEAHDEQITKMKNVTNSIINKKTEEVKVANAYMRAQLDLQLDKFQKTQKSLRQEVETLRLEISTQKIKNADLNQKYIQANEFLQIYQKKFNQLTASSLVVEEDNQNLEENVQKYQQLYREEKNKNEALLVQKQALNKKLAEISQEYQKKKYGEQQVASRFTEIESENKKTKSELAQAKNEIQNLQNILKISKKQFQDKSRVAMLDISRTQSSYYTALEHNFNQQKQRNRELQAQVQSLKLRLERALQQSQKVVNLQDAINSKNDQINDFKRKNIISEKQISVKDAQLKQAKNQTDILRRQNNALKAKLLQSGQQLRKSYEFKDFEGKKITQKLNQQLSSALSELREERRISARMQSDVQSYRSEIQRLQTIIDQAKSKEMNLYEQASQLRTSLQNASEQLQRHKKQITFKNGLIDSLNNQISALQQKLYKTSQQSSQNKIKLQQVDNQFSELKRQINGIKIYLKEVEDYGNTKVASGSWQEQRDRQNIANFAQRIRKILKKVEVSQSTGQYRAANILSATQSPVPDYLRSYNQPVFGGYETRRTSLLNSPLPVSYGGENQYNYGDYN